MDTTTKQLEDITEPTAAVIQKKRGRAPKPREPKPEKPPRVNKTDHPDYTSNYGKAYFQEHKEAYKEYADRAKEKFHHCEACNITTAFRHHLRHDKTQRHIRNVAPPTPLLVAVEL